MNKQKNKSSCNKNYCQEISNIKVKTTLKRTSLYRINKGVSRQNASKVDVFTLRRGTHSQKGLKT